MRYRSVNGKGYWGIDADMTTANPQISANTWAAGPVGLTNLVDTFIESGPIKACDIDCGLYPYSTWKRSGGNVGRFTDTSANLSPGGNYGYKSYFFGNNQWQSQFCDAYGCRGLASPDLGTDSLPYVATAGESDPGSIRWGVYMVSAAKYKAYNEASWEYWCYTQVYTNVVGGKVSPCVNNSWSIIYAYEVFLPSVLKDYSGY